MFNVGGIEVLFICLGSCTGNHCIPSHLPPHHKYMNDVSRSSCPQFILVVPDGPLLPCGYLALHKINKQSLYTLNFATEVTF